MNDTRAVDNLADLEALLQVTFHDRTLLQRAITHHSCCPDTAIRDSYDTLEFLGDAIISAHVVEHIYRNFPQASEGEMTAIKSEVVSRRVLAQVGQRIGLFPYICVDVANLRTFNERSRDSLCADVLEAIVGAIHIDRGTDVARNFVERSIFPMIELIKTHTIDTNPKGRLQKLILQRSGSLPRYRVLEQGGRNNDRIFLVGVFNHDILLGVGRASSIKEAGRLAAHEALKELQKKDTQ
ncbi:MAG: ribonuclease III [Ktedonobacteraceae bacterium]